MACGQFHIFDPEKAALCPNCKMVHFFCSRCGQEIDKRLLRDCPKETRNLALKVAEALMEGEYAKEE